MPQPRDEEDRGDARGKKGRSQAVSRYGHAHEDGARREADIGKSLEDGEGAGYGIWRRGPLPQSPPSDVEHGPGKADGTDEEEGSERAREQTEEAQGRDGAEDSENESAVEALAPDEESRDETRKQRSATESCVQVARASGADVQDADGEDHTEHVEGADKRVIEEPQHEKSPRGRVVQGRGQVGGKPGPESKDRPHHVRSPLPRRRAATIATACDQTKRLPGDLRSESARDEQRTAAGDGGHRDYGRPDSMPSDQATDKRGTGKARATLRPAGHDVGGRELIGGHDD